MKTQGVSERKSLDVASTRKINDVTVPLLTGDVL